MSLALLDWRRRVFALYAEVRATPDPGAAHRRWCDVRDELFATHPASPVPPDERARFSGLDVAPYDRAFRFEVTVDAARPTRMEVPTGTDGVVPFERIGVVRLPDLGELDVWWVASYGGGLFVPVRDGLAGRQTYGGGRYVLDTIKGADLGGGGPGGDVGRGEGPLVVDLNFAYNPSCAYDAAWACPLAPPGNVVAAPVPVGERWLS